MVLKYVYRVFCSIRLNPRNPLLGNDKKTFFPEIMPHFPDDTATPAACTQRVKVSHSHQSLTANWPEMTLQNATFPSSFGSEVDFGKELGQGGLLLARASLAFLHGFTLLALSFYAHVLRTRVEISHPVFAVIFQETLVLCCCEAASFAAVLIAEIDYSYSGYYLPLFLQGLSVHFHQWSWFAVTCLRCHASTTI